MTDKQTRALYIARILLQDGFTVAGAAGSLGNIDPESGFEPKTWPAAEPREL